MALKFLSFMSQFKGVPYYSLASLLGKNSGLQRKTIRVSLFEKTADTLVLSFGIFTDDYHIYRFGCSHFDRGFNPGIELYWS